MKELDFDDTDYGQCEIEHDSVDTITRQASVDIMRSASEIHFTYSPSSITHMDKDYNE